MSRKITPCSGAEHELRQAYAGWHRSTAFVELITTAALALSTAVAVTAVSFGIARADVMAGVAKGGGGSLAVAVLLALLLSATGALTALRPSASGSDQTR
jgi:hypothetical protein